MKNYKVVWHYEGPGQMKYKVKERMYQKEFTEAYNRFCDVTNNGLIDALNAEWNKLYPDSGSCDNDRYTAFMAAGYRKAVDRMNLKTEHIPLFTVGSECQLYGCLDTHGVLYFTLMEC